MLLRSSFAVLALALTLTACGDSDAPEAATTAAATTAAAVPLKITDQWVKTADKGMSAAFGTLVNDSDADITVVSAATSVSPMVELHEVVGAEGKMKMQPKAGGFTVPAHGRLELKPGGFHLMLMGLSRPIKPGDTLEFSLKLASGGTMTFEALAKAFNGGNEKYDPAK